MSDFILGNLFSIKNYKKTYLNRSAATGRGATVIKGDAYLRRIAPVGKLLTAIDIYNYIFLPFYTSNHINYAEK